jgi:hypothetical protein
MQWGAFCCIIKVLPETVSKMIVVDKPVKRGSDLDNLEPVLNTHRLVVDQNVVEADLALETKAYSLFYQLSHITRKRTLKHDDRLDVLAMAVSYWTEELKRDEDQAKNDYELQELQDILDWYDSLGVDFGCTVQQWAGAPRR